MIFPSCGKVLVIDDKIEEAMPLIELLGKQGVPSLYYSGKGSELPITPLNSVRLVFCDLKFNIAPDEKSVISNIVSILNRLISAENGPYILLIWSTHESDYLAELTEALNGGGTCPEFILPLSKNDYFISWDEGEKLSQEMLQEIEKMELDSIEHQKIREIVESKTADLLPLRKEPIENAINRIGDKLSDALKSANLFHLFVLWENTISASALQTVNSIFKEVPNKVPNNMKLQAMLFYLSYYQLEQQLDEVEPAQKLLAALKSLNEMLLYFCDENVEKLSLQDIGIEDVVGQPEIEVPSSAKFNHWMWIAASPIDGAPGTVYLDVEQKFCFHGLVVPKISKGTKGKTPEERQKIMTKNREQYDSNVSELAKIQGIRNILVDISADCDYAQRKQYVAKLIPGIMIPYDEYTKNTSKFNDTIPDYIISFNGVEIDGVNWTIVFNLNQLFSIDISEVEKMESQFAFSQSAQAYLKQHAAACVAKQGIAAFG